MGAGRCGSLEGRVTLSTQFEWGVSQGLGGRVDCYKKKNYQVFIHDGTKGIVILPTLQRSFISCIIWSSSLFTVSGPKSVWLGSTYIL